MAEIQIGDIVSPRHDGRAGRVVEIRDGRAWYEYEGCRRDDDEDRAISDRVASLAERVAAVEARKAAIARRLSGFHPQCRGQRWATQRWAWSVMRSANKSDK